MKRKRYSVLTYIFDKGDVLREVTEDDNVEYICVTDNPDLKSDTWKIIIDDDLVGTNPLLASFYVRYHPFKYCTGDICIRIDGSIQIKESLLPIFDEFDAGGNDICIMTNSRAKSIQEELFYWTGIYYADIKKKQVELYKELEIDINKEGCIQSPISITRNNDICNECDALSWKIIESLSTDKYIMRPSQVAMTVAIAYTKGLKIMFVDESLIQSNFLQWCNHNRDSRRKSFFIVKHKKFFDKDIKIHQFNGVHSNDDLIWREASPRECLRNKFNITK